MIGAGSEAAGQESQVQTTCVRAVREGAVGWLAPVGVAVADPLAGPKQRRQSAEGWRSLIPDHTLHASTSLDFSRGLLVSLTVHCCDNHSTGDILCSGNTMLNTWSLESGDRQCATVECPRIAKYPRSPSGSSKTVPFIKMQITRTVYFSHQPVETIPEMTYRSWDSQRNVLKFFFFTPLQLVQSHTSYRVTVQIVHICLHFRLFLSTLQ